MSDDPRKWDQVLESVEFAINNTICRSTRNTPSKLLFGLDQVRAINDLVRLSLEQPIETQDLKESREAASCKIIKNQTENEKAYDRSRKKATMYNVGDYVMIVNIDTTAGIDKKLIPKYKGPYVVHKVLNTDRYVVTDIPGFQITQIPYQGIISADRMKAWIHDLR